MPGLAATPPGPPAPAPPAAVSPAPPPPQELAHDLIADAVFADPPLGRPVIGTADVISSIPRAAIARYHGEMYVPGNIVVAAAGNFEHEHIVELVARALERRRSQNA